MAEHRKLATVAGVVHRTEIMKLNIRKVGVIGAGQMGNGIAHVCALAGFDVLLNDVAPDRIKAGIATINGNMARQVVEEDHHGRSPQGRARAHRAADTLEALGDCDLVIETATEKEEVKRKIFSELCASLKPEAILGTNTSSISITRLAIVDRSAGAFHRHPLHEPGAGDGAGRADPRHRHRRSDVREPPRPSSPSSARPSRCRRTFRPSSSTASCCR